MSTKPNKPACPNCGYDLSGLFDPNSSCTCPECNQTTTHAHATQRINRWNSLALAIACVFIVPLSMTGTAWVFMLHTDWYTSWTGSASLLLLASQILAVPLLGFLFLAAESAFHTREQSARHIRPSAWLFNVLVLLSATLSSAACYITLVILLDAYASI